MEEKVLSLNRKVNSIGNEVFAFAQQEVKSYYNYTLAKDERKFKSMDLQFDEVKKLNSKNKSTDVLTEVFLLYLNSTLIVDILRRLDLQYLTNIFRNIVYIFIFCYVLYDIYRRNRAYTVLVPLIYLFLFGISILIDEQIFILHEQIYIFLSRCFPGMYLAIYCNIDEVFYLKYRKYYILVFIYILIGFIMSENIYPGSYMTFSYNLVLPISLLVNQVLQKPSIIKVIFSCVGIISILLKGARGPIVLLILAAILVFVYKVKQMKLEKKIFLVTGTLILFGVFILFGSSIITLLYNKFPDSRTLILLFTGDFLNASSRIEYYKVAIQEIFSNPFAVRGIFSDRIFIGSSFKFSPEEFSGTYAHNIILEVLFQSGLIIGLGLLSVFIWFLVKKLMILINKCNKYELIFGCSIIAIGVFQLLISGSYLTTEKFYVALGFLLQVRKEEKKPYINTTEILYNYPDVNIKTKIRGNNISIKFK